ncbi:hypothetical protein PHYPSEUDO_001897 [Phytophthora pseudosyringae]|uniref:Uncharacterized protein n=1 Tax=Phytophthora pseudosyringae TaxID=221518 RepID=A0A8T1WIJ2_9STRA|nr:hypothetical protein PHYPSEUDO_001897 [Phytophthora pseudosyringae]
MTRRGRVTGVENYSPEDVETLLEFTGNVLPTGANEWEFVRQSYEDYAVENNGCASLPSSARHLAELGDATVPATGAVVPAARVARRSLSALRRRPVARVRVRLV